MQTRILILLLAAPLVLGGCTPEVLILDTEVGTWQLSETLIDPGDGSGQFEPVKSRFTITFGEDGTFETNGLLCSYRRNIFTQTSGTYTPETSALLVTQCTDNQATPEVEMRYELSEDFVYIFLWCDEACTLKFEKARN